MAVILTTSATPGNESWMIRNSVYKWFVGIILEGIETDQEVLDALETSILVHGLLLGHIFTRDSKLALRLRHLLLKAAKEIAAGTHVMRDEAGKPIFKNAEGFQNSFTELANLLQKWHPEAC